MECRTHRARPFASTPPCGPLNEYPMTTFRFWNSPNMPVAGGGYLRILPDWYTRMGVHRAWKEGLPVITYVHPWEVDPGQPRMNARLKSRLRHYTNLRRTAGRLRKLVALEPFIELSTRAGSEPGTADLYIVHQFTEKISKT